MSALEAAQVLGKYAIVRELGRGGFATVYLAQDTVLRRSVALKILHPALLADQIFVQRFEQEAHATAQLDHPHIATIFDLGQLEGRLYIAMRLLSGGTLADRIKQDGPLPFTEAARVIAEIGGALDHAHAAGFIHRDVKPTNILFDARKTAVLADFGMVKAVESSVIARTTMGNVIGTPAYIAPEVWEGKEGGPATDVYALGCVLFEMLTGELLFKGSTPPAVMLAHFRPHEYPAQWPAGTPSRIKAVLEQALARDPAERYANASALASELRGLREQPFDVTTLPNQEKDERAGQITQWRDAALEAERNGQIDAARVAARRCLELAPEDVDAKALLERLSTADRRVEAAPPLAVGEAPKRSQETRRTNQLAPAIRSEATAVSPIWTAIALTIVTWTLSHVFYEYIAMVIWTRNAAEIGSFLGGAIAGFCLGHISRLISAEMHIKHILMMAAGWAVAWLVRLEIGIAMAELLGEFGPISSWNVGNVMKCLIGGIVTALVLRRAMPALPSRVMYLIPIGWGMGFVLGAEIATAVGGQYEPTFRYLIFIALNAAISAAIGGGVMFWAISSPRPRGAQPEALSTLLPVIGSSIGAMLGAMGGGLIGNSLIGVENGFILGLMLGAIGGAIIGGTIFRQSG